MLMVDQTHPTIYWHPTNEMTCSDACSRGCPLEVLPGHQFHCRNIDMFVFEDFIKM